MHMDRSMKQWSPEDPACGSPETVFSDWPPLEEEATQPVFFHGPESDMDPDYGEPLSEGEDDAFKNTNTDSSDFTGPQASEGVDRGHLDNVRNRADISSPTKEDIPQPGEYKVFVWAEGEAEPNNIGSQNVDANAFVTPSSPPAPVTMPTELADLLPDANENMAWMTFLNSEGEDSDEVLQNAFNEAKYETSRAVQPRDDPKESDSEDIIAAADCDVETAATCGSVTSSERSIVEASSSVVSDRSAAVPSVIVSDHTAKGPSCLPTIFEGSESWASMESTEADSELPSADVILHDHASITAQPSEPETSEVTSPTFRFAQPERFVGRLAKSPEPAAPSPLVQLSVHAPLRGRGRPKKKARPGWTNIRALPDYHSDPIDD
ncbi:hypothetical protein ACRALDRAFT_2051808 [Sodiomyces alcalophilus JCM 7366]|uniref:uncharacterized protein n=1 Tax=Sodiomyces alcalophilus JCM 7366 TaxID=591952 RepID=UPI0039B38332